jgi:toxin ParE1/3/4
VGRVLRAKSVGRDLDGIFDEIFANNGVNVAIAQMNRIERAFERLGRFPNLGRERSDLKPGLRSWAVTPWTVLYRLNAADVIIIRVLDGRMNLSSLLGKKS